MMGRQRYRKAKILAYPKDWFYCFGFGFITGVILCLLVIRT